uniref:Pyruvate dehydrogenase E1 component subunit alpha n=1 Tax=Panagrellus redivivus TaxID=6233 RepID=A0A7E4VYU1_PANRE
MGVRSLSSTVNEATFQTRPYKLHKLDTPPKSEVVVTRDDAIHYYREMQVIRRLETAAGNLYKEKIVRGFCHLYTGQEACAVGMHAAMDKDDGLITSYRCHGWTYLLGSTVVEVISELSGKISGNVYGKGGSMHMYERTFFGGNGIVGAQQALGAGVAFAHKYNGKKNVCFTLYGDGAANQGQLFECTNMAKLWNVPVIFVCENNGYGMGTAANRASADTNYYTRGDFVPGIWVDAMDVISVREAVQYCRDYANAGKGPLMLELATYRFVGHSMSDPGTGYRTREEVQEARKTRDPIHGFKDKIIAANLVTEAELKDIDKSVRKEVDDAVMHAHQDGVLPWEGLYTDLYHNTPPQFIRGCITEESIVQPYTNSSELVKKLGLKPKTYSA